MRPHKPYNKKHISIFLALLCVIISSYILAMLNVTGIYWLFGLALVVLVASIFFLFFAIHHFYLYTKPVIKSMCKSAWKELKNDQYTKPFLKKHKTKTDWIKKRFSNESWTGLFLTTMFGFFLIELLYFFNIAFDVVFENQMFAMDLRFANMAPVIRSEGVTNFAVYITNLAGWKTIIFTVFISAGYLFFKKHYHLAGALIVGLFTEGIISFLLKNTFDRPRPVISQLVNANDYSFPSGHTFAATVIFGLLAYFIFKGIDKRVNRVILFSAMIFFIVLVGTSRMYLGVHYLSDVLGGVALGLMVITVIIGFLEIDEKYFTKKGIGNLEPEALGIIIIIVLAFNVFPTINTKILDVSQVGSNIYLQKDKIDSEFLNSIPKFSETLVGGPMEPIGIVYVGSKEQIISAFAKAGWYKAEEPTLKNTFDVYAAGFYNKPDPKATMTPSFFNAKPHELAFEKPTDKNSVRQRHHTRLWKTSYVLKDGREIWVSTASFDERIQMRKLVIGTHKIDPDIDKEREVIKDALKDSAKDNYYLKITDAHIGSNSIGDEFFTDGKAVVLYLK